MSDPNAMPDPMDLLASAQEALAAQAQAAQQEVEGHAGGDLVRVRMNGSGEITAVRLDPSVVDPQDVEMLEDLLLAALRDAATKVAELQREALGVLGQMDLGSLGGLLGGGGPPPQDR